MNIKPKRANLRFNVVLTDLVIGLNHFRDTFRFRNALIVVCFGHAGLLILRV